MNFDFSAYMKNLMGKMCSDIEITDEEILVYESAYKLGIKFVKDLSALLGSPILKDNTKDSGDLINKLINVSYVFSSLPFILNHQKSLTALRGSGIDIEAVKNWANDIGGYSIGLIAASVNGFNNRFFGEMGGKNED